MKKKLRWKNLIKSKLRCKNVTWSYDKSMVLILNDTTKKPWMCQVCTRIWGPKDETFYKQTEAYRSGGGKEVLRTELYFNIIGLLCNLVCFIHLKTLLREVTDYFQGSVSFTRWPKMSTAQKKLRTPARGSHKCDKIGL